MSDERGAWDDEVPEDMMREVVPDPNFVVKGEDLSAWVEVPGGEPQDPNYEYWYDPLTEVLRKRARLSREVPGAKPFNAGHWAGISELAGPSDGAMSEDTGTKILTQRDVNEELRARLQALEVQVESLGDAATRILEKIMHIEGRFPEGVANRSAALKRDMNEADAEMVLTDMRPHEELGVILGLTYSQVYSCRYGYTFKRVHRRLEEGGWVCPWERTRKPRI
jgi:hypothetical protein